MPSDGANPKYIEKWQEIAENNRASFNWINNTTSNQSEKQKLLSSNILILAGGNTFTFLNNLRQSGLNKTIEEFTQKDNFVLAGFSAGALVLTPSIEICNLPNYDKNLIELKDLTGLGIVNFEVFPHYSKEWSKFLNNYRKQTENEVKEIANEEYIVINF